MAAESNDPILQVKHLTTSFRTDRGIVTAVDDMSFDLAPGETLGIVGESGCGKTVASKTIMRLLPEMTGILQRDGDLPCFERVVDVPRPVRTDLDRAGVAKPRQKAQLVRHECAVKFERALRAVGRDEPCLHLTADRPLGEQCP